MSFAGFLCVCWIGIGAIAFLAFSGLSRLTARGDVEADLGIVGDAELRMLVGGRDEQRPSLEARLAQFNAPGPQHAAPGPQPAWFGEGPRRGSGFASPGGFASSGQATSIGTGYTS